MPQVSLGSKTCAAACLFKPAVSPLLSSLLCPHEGDNHVQLIALSRLFAPPTRHTHTHPHTTNTHVHALEAILVRASHQLPFVVVVVVQPNTNSLPQQLNTEPQH